MNHDLQNLDKNKILSKITESLSDSMKKAFDWIHTDEGQIVVNAITSLSSYAVGEPTGVMIPLIFQSSDLIIRKRFLKNIPDLMNRLDKIKLQINEDFLKSGAGQNLLRETLKQIVNEENEEKTELYKRFLLNAYTKRDVKKDRISAYVSILTSLEPVQLQILGALCKPEETTKRILKKRDLMEPRFRVSLKNDIRELLAIDDEIFERAVSKLESENIISRQTGGLEISWYSGEIQSQHEHETMIRMIDVLKRLISPFGNDFVSYLTEVS